MSWECDLTLSIDQQGIDAFYDQTVRWPFVPYPNLEFTLQSDEDAYTYRVQNVLWQAGLGKFELWCKIADGNSYVLEHDFLAEEGWVKGYDFDGPEAPIDKSENVP